MSRVNRTRGTLPRSAGTSSCAGHHVASRMRSPRHHVLPGAYSTGFPHGSPARAPTVEKDSTALRAPLEYHSMPLDYRHPSEALRANEDIHQCVPHRTQQHISSIPLTDSDFPTGPSGVSASTGRPPPTTLSLRAARAPPNQDLYERGKLGSHDPRPSPPSSFSIDEHNSCPVMAKPLDCPIAQRAARGNAVQFTGPSPFSL